MRSPVLSIITVTWNCVATIDQTLESVLAIKSDAIEYIVVDGGSDDGTLDRIDAFGNLVDQLVSEPDNGIYHAMNKGVAMASGHYLLFINGDDQLIDSGFLKLLSALEGRRSKIYCATTYVGDSKDPTEKLIARPWMLLFFNTIPHPSSFVPRALMAKFPFREDLKIASDYDFFLRVFLRGIRFEVVDAVTALHHRGGASGDSEKSAAEITAIRKARLRGAFFVVRLAEFCARSLWAGLRRISRW